MPESSRRPVDRHPAVRRHARALTYTWTWGQHPTPWGPAPTATAQTVLTVAFHPGTRQYIATLHRQDVFVSDGPADVWRDVPGTMIVAAVPGDRFSSMRLAAFARTVLYGLKDDPAWFSGPSRVQGELPLAAARA